MPLAAPAATTTITAEDDDPTLDAEALAFIKVAPKDISRFPDASLAFPSQRGFFFPLFSFSCIYKGVRERWYGPSLPPPAPGSVRHWTDTHPPTDTTYQLTTTFENHRMRWCPA